MPSNEQNNQKETKDTKETKPSLTFSRALKSAYNRKWTTVVDLGYKNAVTIDTPPEKLPKAIQEVHKELVDEIAKFAKEKEITAKKVMKELDEAIAGIVTPRVLKEMGYDPTGSWTSKQRRTFKDLLRRAWEHIKRYGYLYAVMVGTLVVLLAFPNLAGAVTATAAVTGLFLLRHEIKRAHDELMGKTPEEEVGILAAA